MPVDRLIGFVKWEIKIPLHFTFDLGKRQREIWLSGRNEGIRTLDLLVPNQAHYQAVLRPEATAINYYNDF